MLQHLDWQPDIIHCNDWHTAIVPNWLKTIYKDDFFRHTATVYTIHNLAYQGIFGYRVLEIAGIAEYGFIDHPQMADLAEVVDFMARGIYFADVLSTVSRALRPGNPDARNLARNWTRCCVTGATGCSAS